MIRSLKFALLLANVLFFWVAAWFILEYRAPLVRIREPAIFEVEKGKGMEAVSRRLEKAGLIRRREFFMAAYRLFHYPRTLKAGEYRFESPIRMKAVLDALTEGRVYLHPVTLPEGLIGLEIADLLQDKGVVTAVDFLAEFSRTDRVSGWDPAAQDLEGYLYPETYNFTKNDSAEEVISRMVVQFTSVFHEGWRQRAAQMGWTIREVVILASLIEKETSRAEERDSISAVFHNRLRIGMKLDCDPTIIYALKRKAAFDGDLRFKDMKLDSPYNTYLHRGLPPGPICNPGRGAIQAALYPAHEPFLYFVARDDGRHHFSLSYREHQQAVRKFQK